MFDCVVLPGAPKDTPCSHLPSQTHCWLPLSAAHCSFMPLAPIEDLSGYPLRWKSPSSTPQSPIFSFSLLTHSFWRPQVVTLCLSSSIYIRLEGPESWGWEQIYQLEDRTKPQSGQYLSRSVNLFSVWYGWADCMRCCSLSEAIL